MRSNQNKTLKDFSHGCANCRVRNQCLPGTLSRSDVEQFERVVVHHPPLHRGDHLFEQGSTFGSIYVVRSGSLKYVEISENGNEQVNSFYMCGDILGLESIETRRHSASAVALETTSVCSIPINRLNPLMRKISPFQRQLFRVLSYKLEVEKLMELTFATGSAQQKLIGFFWYVSEHHGACNFSPDEFILHMSRREIANYLGIAYETLSRLLAHFQKESLIRITKRNVVQILQPYTLFSTLEYTPRKNMLAFGHVGYRR